MAWGAYELVAASPPRPSASARSQRTAACFETLASATVVRPIRTLALRASDREMPVAGRGGSLVETAGAARNRRSPVRLVRAVPIRLSTGTEKGASFRDRRVLHLAPVENQASRGLRRRFAQASPKGEPERNAAGAAGVRG
jgi:hypothetical protein